jgi:hypothetical protein
LESWHLAWAYSVGGLSLQSMKQQPPFSAFRHLLLLGLFYQAICLYGQVDFRYYQSPVHRVQDSAHTCGCAVAGMLENFAGLPSDLNGAAWEEALGGREDLATGLQILSGRGFRSRAWPAGQGAQPLLEATLVKSGAAAQDVAQLKAWLDQGLKGVVVRYRAPLPIWDALSARDPHIRMAASARVREGQRSWAWKKAIRKFPDWATRLADSSLRLEPLCLPSQMGEQAVLVVGYDLERGFLVKHCRGTQWGQGGYAWLEFDYHRCMALEAAAILLAKPTAAPRARQSKEALQLRLKCLPELLEGKRHLQLSVWIAAGGLEQPWKNLRYELQVAGRADLLVLKPMASLEAGESGYAVYLPMEGLGKVEAVRVVVDDNAEMSWRFGGLAWRHGDYGAE